MSFNDPTLLAGLGCALAIFLCGLGAAYATNHASFFALRHQDMMAMVPVVQAGVLAVYGIIIAYLIQSRITDTLSIVEAYKFFAAGLTVGLACLASGVGMSKFLSQINDSEFYFVRKGKAEESKQGTASKKFSFVTFVLCLIYLEAIGLYGLIIALFLVG
jgi:V-type H+-transporting ATPase proteolipid subunit